MLILYDVLKAGYVCDYFITLKWFMCNLEVSKGKKKIKEEGE